MRDGELRNIFMIIIADDSMMKVVVHGGVVVREHFKTFLKPNSSR